MPLLSGVNPLFTFVKLNLSYSFSEMSKNPWNQDTKGEDSATSTRPAPALDHETGNRTEHNDVRGGSRENFLEKIHALYSGQIPGMGRPASVALIVIGLAALWLMSGFYVVAPEQKAIVTRFGKYTRTMDSGLHYHLPLPIESVIKETVTRVHTVKIDSGGATDETIRRRIMRSGYVNENTSQMQGALMLTGDQNVIEMQFEVQWRISNLKDFVFNIKNPTDTIVNVSQSIIREIVAQNHLAAILTDGRALIESNAQSSLQHILDRYGTGVEIVLVQMLKADPPSQVIDAFRDVQTARVDKESKINVADAYSNDVLPKARGRAESIINEAKGYAAEVMSRAKGDASKFIAVYNQYKNHKYVTRRRIYLETMEDVLSRVDKIVIDNNSARHPVLPHMPIQWLDKGKKTNEDGVK